MPELPEVETIARGVDARVRGDRIAEAWFGRHREPFKTPPGVQARGLEGRRVLTVRRVGKHIVCDLASGAGATVPDAQWIVHLGMTGRLLVTTPDAPVAPHTHARLRLESGRELRFVDPRRFGRLEFRELNRGEGFGAPGAEPLEIGKAEFAALFRGRRTPVKAALLNQTLLAGVGNIYADESLYRAGIRPRRQAGRLTAAELERLRKSLREVLHHAIRLGGSSVSDYVDAEGERGFFQMEHRVYQRTGEPCRKCGTPIRRVVVAGRSTHYCPQCQS
ncbi:MAG TPA: bifunctional DNA-formamidopyrimidine glycosylase/DNA-(apurinic or apyrimidinic site) lyase [Terracidiphilus sp.]|nr:bifunctional DNA-formamidopyrimidine glycosylase/DNA-(apurinic or apyrimidinic site) lyase [Terracidiphilus sp.]